MDDNLRYRADPELAVLLRATVVLGADSVNLAMDPATATEFFTNAQ